MLQRALLLFVACFAAFSLGAQAKALRAFEKQAAVFGERVYSDHTTSGNQLESDLQFHCCDLNAPAQPAPLSLLKTTDSARTEWTAAPASRYGIRAHFSPYAWNVPHGNRLRWIMKMQQ